MITIAFAALFVVSLALAIARRSTTWTIATLTSGLIYLVVAFAVPQGRPEADPSAAVRTHIFSDSSGRFSIEVPGNWSELKLQGNDAPLQLGDRASDEFLIVIEDSKTDLGESMGIDAYANLAATLITESLDEPEQGEMAKLEINGLPARRCRIAGSTQGVRLVYLNTYIESPEHLYQLMSWTLPAKEQTALPVFENTAATFREKIAATAP